MTNILFSITFFKKFVAICSYDMNRICLKYINSLHGKFYEINFILMVRFVHLNIKSWSNFFGRNSIILI